MGRIVCCDLILPSCLQVLALTAADVWNTFLVHTFIKEDGVFLAILPQVLSVLRQKLMRVGDPSLSNHPSCLYNKLDFDSLEEYNYFFSSEVILLHLHYVICACNRCGKI